MKVNFAITLLAITAILFSCKKEQTSFSTPSSFTKSKRNELQASIALTFAKAIEKSPSIRKFLREEALKQFDKDYDVLYQMVKDQKLEDGETFSAAIAAYATSKQAFDAACNELPLLTFFIPSVPNFSAQTWNTATQIPIVALEPTSDNKVRFFSAIGEKETLPVQAIPGFPVIVIKDNERVELSTTRAEVSDHKIIKSITQPFYANGLFSFRFWDPCFDGIQPNNPNTRVGIIGASDPNMDIATINVNAYNSGAEWHRDFVYYGITPTSPDGVFTGGKYIEFLRSFHLINKNELSVISDHANDPHHTSSTIITNLNDIWTDGNFEFKISIMINSKNGTGQELKKAFTATGEDLFTTYYHQFGLPGIYKIDSIQIKEFYPTNLEIVPWDLENYGSAWKFVVAEYDPTEELTKTVTNTTTFSGNFEINLSTGEKTKIGAKFGASATSTQTTTYTYKTTTGSEDLAEGILDFRYPIMTGTAPIFGINFFSTYEVTTGMVGFSIEPKQMY